MFEFMRSTRSSAGKTDKDGKKASKKPSGKWEKVIVSIPKTGSSRRRDKMEMGTAIRPHNVPLTKSLEVAGPDCKMVDLWKSAKNNGAADGDLATVTYDRDGYLFEIEKKNFVMRFDFACKPLWMPGKVVNPVADFAHVRSHVPSSARFLGMTARAVRSDGTADTTADENWVRYEFVYEKALQRPEKIEVMLRQGGLRVGRQFLPLGDKPTSIDPPTCDLSGMWKAAIEKGARTERTARITYDGASYQFRQDPPAFSIQFDAACNAKP